MSFHLGPLGRNLFRSVPIERNKKIKQDRSKDHIRLVSCRFHSTFVQTPCPLQSTNHITSYHMLDWPRRKGDRKRREKLRLAQAEVSNVISHKTHADCFWEAIWRIGLCFTRENTAVLLLTSLVNRDFEPSAASVGEYQYLNAWKRLIIVYRKSFCLDLTCTNQHYGYQYRSKLNFFALLFASGKGLERRTISRSS